MKLIKIMVAGMVVMSFALAQDDTQGGQPTGPPPCDPNATYSVADPGPDGGCANYNDCNGNGAYDVGEPCGDGGGQGLPPFGDVDANEDGGIDREEARAFFGKDDEGNDDPEFDARFDNYAGEDGVVDEAEYATKVADQGDDQGQSTCDVCGYTFAGEGDHHGHCDKCDFVFTSDNDQHGHCDQCDYIFAGEGDHHGHCDKCDFVFTSDNDQHGHCDQCDYIFGGEGDQHGHCDKCDHIWSGDPEDHHGHCDHEGCDFVGNTNEDWENHSHDDGGTGGPGGAPTNHWDGNCAAMCGGHGEYWLDSDGDGQPEDGPYATWDHDANGNPVDCGCGGDNGDHDGDEGEGEGGDHNDQGGGPQTCQFVDNDGNQCSYVFTGTEADQDHHHN
jgi:hypothetical protein